MGLIQFKNGALQFRGGTGKVIFKTYMKYANPTILMFQEYVQPDDYAVYVQATNNENADLSIVCDTSTPPQTDYPITPLDTMEIYLTSVESGTVTSYSQIQGTLKDYSDIVQSSITIKNGQVPTPTLTVNSVTVEVSETPGEFDFYWHVSVKNNSAYSATIKTSSATGVGAYPTAPTPAINRGIVGAGATINFDIHTTEDYATNIYFSGKAQAWEYNVIGNRERLESAITSANYHH